MNIHYHIHKSLLLVPMLSPLNPVLTLMPYVFEIQFNIILPSTPECPKWPLFFRFVSFVFTSHVHHACGMFCPYYPLLFKCHNVSWKVQVVNLLIMKIHHHRVTSFLLSQNNLSNDLFLYIPNTRLWGHNKLNRDHFPSHFLHKD